MQPPDDGQPIHGPYDEAGPPLPGPAVTCTADGCDNPAKARGLCQNHYRRQRKFETGQRVNNGGRPPTAPPTDLGARVADLRLAVEAVSARVTQALLVLEDPAIGAKHNVTASELLTDALAELDNVRNR